MRFRFLYLSPSGGQTEVASLDDLRVVIEKGTVGEATPLFDVLTQQWAPARAHAVYRLLCDESRIAVGGATAAPPTPAGLPDLGLSMTAATSAASDTDLAVRRLMRERESDGGGARPRAPERWTTAPGWNPEAEPAAATSNPEPSLAVRDPRPARPPIALLEAAVHTPSTTSLLGMTIPFDRLRVLGIRGVEALGRLAEHRSAPALLVAAGMFGLLVVLVTAVRGGTSAQTGPTTAAMVGPDMRGLVGRFGAAEDSGFRHMVAGMDSLRRAYDVVDVPRVWLEGSYLADATRFPEVRDYWDRYKSFLTAVQASDTTLFRAGFVAQMRHQGVQGPVLSLRLSQAMGEFEETQPTRSSMYLHMQELTSASLALHDLLVERESDISYEPALNPRLSRDPVVEALPLDTLLRDRMWVLLDRIFASLERLGGDLGASRDNLTETLLQGVEASQH